MEAAAVAAVRLEVFPIQLHKVLAVLMGAGPGITDSLVLMLVLKVLFV
jgi:hypothetical protein